MRRPAQRRTGSRRAEFDAYLSAIDAALQENMLIPRIDRTAATAFRSEVVASGVPVLSIDFVSGDDEQRAAQKAQAREQALRFRFMPYFADDTLFDRLYPPVDLR